MSSNSRIDVEVSGVFQSAIVASVRRTVSETLGHLAGRWEVVIVPAQERGRWKLHLHGGFGHHIASFAASPAHMAATIRRRLLSFLKSVVPPIGAVRRPVLKVVWSRPANSPVSVSAVPAVATAVPAAPVPVEFGAKRKAR